MLYINAHSIYFIWSDKGCICNCEIGWAPSWRMW